MNCFSFFEMLIDVVLNYLFDNVVMVQMQMGDDDDIGINFGFFWLFNLKFLLGGVYCEGGEFDYNYVVNVNFVMLIFNVLMVYGIGIVVCFMVVFIISFDVNEVEYLVLVDNFMMLFDGNCFDFFVVDDVIEVYFGFEYCFLNMVNLIIFCVGVWEDLVYQIC